MAERNGFRLGRSSTLVQWAVAGFTWNTVNISAFFGGAVFIYANSGGARLALVPMICIGLVVLAGYLVRMAYKAHYTDWRRGGGRIRLAARVTPLFRSVCRRQFWEIGRQWGEPPRDNRCCNGSDHHPNPRSAGGRIPQERTGDFP